MILWNDFFAKMAVVVAHFTIGLPSPYSHAFLILLSWNTPYISCLKDIREKRMSSLDEQSLEDRAEAFVVEGVVADHDNDDNVAEAVVAEKDDDTAGNADVESMTHGDDDDDAMTIKSEADEASITSKSKSATKKKPPLNKGKKSRAPAVKGLTIPFRNVKRTMKLDPDIGTVQQEAAILTTLASELFLKSLAKEAHQNAKARGRNTIRYEDIAEARTKDPSLVFLETLLP